MGEVAVASSRRKCQSEGETRRQGEPAGAFAAPSFDSQLATLNSLEAAIETLFTYNTRIVLIGVSLLGACSGLVGSFAVLRRRALTGTCAAHAALPGVCLAFLLVGDKSLPAMLAGAFVTGVLGVLIISGLRAERGSRKTQRSASC